MRKRLASSDVARSNSMNSECTNRLGRNKVNEDIICTITISLYFIWLSNGFFSLKCNAWLVAKGTQNAKTVLPISVKCPNSLKKSTSPTTPYLSCWVSGILPFHCHAQWRSQRGGGRPSCRNSASLSPPMNYTLYRGLYREPPFWVPVSIPCSPLSPPPLPPLLKKSLAMHLATHRAHHLRVFLSIYPYLQSNGGVLKFCFGRDVSLWIWKWTHT